MTVDDLNETIDVLRVALTALQAAVPGQAGRVGATFRYACGDLIAQAPTLLQIGEIGTPLRACFDGAVASGATLNGFATLRSAMWGLSYVSPSAMTLGGLCCCFALNAEGGLLSNVPFTSSSDALAAMAVFQAAIGVAQDWALDNHLSAQYQSLLALGAAVVRDLTARAAPLPRLTTYSFARGTSSLVLAYRLYGDANRADELRAENKAIHPSFMPPSGTALSQ